MLLLNEACGCCHAFYFTQVVFCSDYVFAMAVVVGDSARTEDVADAVVAKGVFVFRVLPKLKIALCESF